MNYVSAVVVCLAFVLSVHAKDDPIVSPVLPGASVAIAPGTAAKPDEAKAAKVKSVDELLAELDAKAAAARARQEEIDRKTKSMTEEETKLRGEAMEAGKKMWGMTDVSSDSGGDQEMVALKKKISDLEAQIKELREEMQRKLENNPEFLERKLKLQDTQKSIVQMRAERGALMQEKAKLNAELQQIERDRLPLLQRKEKEAKAAADAKAGTAK